MITALRQNTEPCPINPKREDKAVSDLILGELLAMRSMLGENRAQIKALIDQMESIEEKVRAVETRLIERPLCPSARRHGDATASRRESRIVAGILVILTAAGYLFAPVMERLARWFTPP